MKTSIFNGINVSKLDFNYFITYRPYHNVYINAMERQIENIFKTVDYTHICFSFENDKYSKIKHSHTLINAKDTEDVLIDKLKINLKSNLNPHIEFEEKLYTEPRTLVNPNTGEKIVSLAKKKITVKKIDMTGKHGEVHIEKIANRQSASLYTMKFTDIGANFGYLQK